MFIPINGFMNVGVVWVGGFKSSRNPNELNYNGNNLTFNGVQLTYEA